MNAPVELRSDPGSLGWDGHLLLLHRTEHERRAALAAWVQRGIDLGAKIFYTEPETEPLQRQLLNLLSQAGVDTTVPASTGQLQVLPLQEFYRPGRQRQLIEESLEEGYPAVQLSSEIVNGLSVQSVEHHNAIERAFADVGSVYPVSALCQHDVASLAGPRLDEVIALHPDGLREQLLTCDSVDSGVVLAGEIDMSNSHLLASVLRSAVEHAGPTFQLDLTRVDFVDVRGIRAIVQTTEAYRRAGGYLLLMARRQCERTLRTLDADQLPNVALLRSDG